jgi:hypothetical protein
MAKFIKKAFAAYLKDSNAESDYNSLSINEQKDFYIWFLENEIYSLIIEIQKFKKGEETNEKK